ncbi:MAG: SRPBCC family protein [Candidatus Limnocylindria bacterium]
MIDIPTQIGAIDRTVSRAPREDGGENVTVLARRTYAADPDDIWSALTDPSRIARWFMPVSGDLRVGGSFQLEGNAGGDILECDRPRRFRVTFGGETSFLEVRLSPDGDGATRLELEHTVPIEMAQSGAGAMWVGPGWDGGLLALGLFLAGEVVADPVAAASSPEALAFSEESVHAWAAAVEASGTATAEQLSEAVQMSMAQFAPGAATEG